LFLQLPSISEKNKIKFNSIQFRLKVCFCIDKWAVFGLPRSLCSVWGVCMGKRTMVLLPLKPISIYFVLKWDDHKMYSVYWISVINKQSIRNLVSMKHRVQLIWNQWIQPHIPSDCGTKNAKPSDFSEQQIVLFLCVFQTRKKQIICCW